MNKLNKINQLKPIDLNCSIFSVYDYDGLSMQELLCQFFTKINGVINETNKIINIVEYLTNNGLKIEVAKKINELIIDGTIKDLINNQLFNELNEKMNKLNFIVYNEVEFEKALNNENLNNIMLGNDIFLNKTYNINKRININGTGHKLVCNKNGLNNILNFINHDVTIENCNIDSNLKGRCFISLSNVNNININNCNFTGYTDNYGYYKTDGLVIVNEDCNNVNFSQCYFYDTGAELENLNRCVSINHITIKKVTFDNCKFINFNQGVVSVSKNIVFKNCYFEGSTDNPIYTTGEILKVIESEFKNNIDETIVTGNKYNFIDNNTFEDYRNKLIAVNEPNMILLNVTNNMIKNKNETGQFISHRNNATVENVILSNNTVDCSRIQYNNVYPIITLYNAENLSIINNLILTNQPINSRMIMTDSKYLKIKDNTFINKNIDDSLLYLNNNNNNPIEIIENNNVVNYLIPITNQNGVGEIRSNKKYFKENKSIYLSKGKPNYTLENDCFILNELYEDNSDILMWFNKNNNLIPIKAPLPRKHQTSNTPINWSKPRFIGDIWIGNNNSIWIGIGDDQTSNSWVEIQTK